MPSYLLAVVGASGSGKTTVSESLKKQFSSMGYATDVISQDDFYNPVGHPLTNYDEPDALDLELLATKLNRIKKGLTTLIPIYDFVTHRRQPTSRSIPKLDVVIVEGLFLLSDESLANVFDASIYLDVDQETCYQRRLLRDQVERGRFVDDINRQYFEQVKPGYELHIAPYSYRANLKYEQSPEVTKDLAMQILKMAMNNGC